MTSIAAFERGDLEHAVRRRIAALLRATGVDEHELRCEIRGNPSNLLVVLTGPAACDNVTQALRVRVLDAVHAAGRTFGDVEVETHFANR